MNLEVLSRVGCHLCEETEAFLRALGLEFRSVDIDADADLVAHYGDAIPVILAGGREVARAPITPEALRALVAASRGGSRSSSEISRR